MSRSVVVVGGGQSGLAVGYYLTRLRRQVRRGRRASSPELAILDARPSAGGSWSQMWPSLRLFSPAEFSSLPGTRMPATAEATASAPDVVDYLRDYAQRHELPVSWGETVADVRLSTSGGFEVTSDRQTRRADAVVMATGTWGRPFVPSVPGAGDFRGAQLHASEYAGPTDLRGSRVAVVGGGNSGAQIAADLRGSAEVTWVTRRAPRFLPDDVDGRTLFELATRKVQQAGTGISDLGDIVALPSVRAARAQGLRARWDLERLTSSAAQWHDGTSTPLDAIVWCTGFRPDLTALQHLELGRHHGIPAVRPDLATASATVPGLYFVGYGDWCGPASATLIGVGRMARATVDDIADGTQHPPTSAPASS